MHQYDTANSGVYQATALMHKPSAEVWKLHCGRSDTVVGHEIFARSTLVELNLIVGMSQIMEPCYWIHQVFHWQVVVTYDELLGQ